MPFGCTVCVGGQVFISSLQNKELSYKTIPGLQPGSVRLGFVIRLISLVATFRRTPRIQIFNSAKGIFVVIIPQFGIVLPNGMPDILSIEIHTHKESPSEVTGCQVHLANNLCFAYQSEAMWWRFLSDHLAFQLLLCAGVCQSPGRRTSASVSQ